MAFRGCGVKLRPSLQGSLLKHKIEAWKHPLSTNIVVEVQTYEVNRKHCAASVLISKLAV